MNWRATIVGFFVAVSAQSAFPATDDEHLLLYLPLSHDIADHSAAAKSVRAEGKITFKDDAASFDGHAWLELPDLRFDQTFAVSVWVKPGTNTTYGILEERESNVRGHHFHLMLRDLHPWLGFYVNDVVSPTAIAPNQWTHLVFQFDGKYQQIWVNGELRCQRSTKRYLGTQGVPRLGKTPRWTNVKSSDYEGGMKEFRVYDRALAPNEIAALASTSARIASAGIASRRTNKGTSGAADAIVNAQAVGTVPTLFIDKERLTITGARGQIYDLEVTSSLSDAWRSLATVTNANGSAEFVDTDAQASPQRFYRILVR